MNPRQSRSGETVINDQEWKVSFDKQKLFTRYFAKSLYIYRCMSEERYWPLLHRNLTYMKGRCVRNNIARDCADVDLICQTLYEKIFLEAEPMKVKSNLHEERKFTNSDIELAISNFNSKTTLSEHKKPIIYNFIVNDEVIQGTQCDTLSCPWCFINAPNIEALILHHKTFHMRFLISFIVTTDGHRIDVKVDPRYDELSKDLEDDTHRDFGFSSKMLQKKLQGPRICFNSWNMLFKAKTKNLHEANSDSINYRNRKFYHTSTCLPIKPNEIDLDSEADNDPDWLLEKTRLMIDEFSDVNEGEKEIMKMWNIHIMTNYKHRGDSMIRVACFDFVEKYGDEVLAKNLFRNFTLHLANLWDFGIINSKDILTTVRRLKEKMGKVPRNGSRLSNNYWIRP